MEGNKQVLSNWQEFLRVDENKSELFHLISDRIVDEEFPGLVIVTRDDEVLSSAPCDLPDVMSCTHEEADTRMFVRATDGAEHGMNNTPFTLALLIRSETGFAPMRAFTLHQLIRISDFNRIKLNHLLEVVSHRFSLLRVLIASVDATRTRTKAEQI